MPTSPTVVELERLRRGCEKLLRELSLALERALMAFEDPTRAAEPFLARLAQLERDAQQLERETPQVAAYVLELRRSTRSQAERLVARAAAAHRARGRVEGRLQTTYNGVVGPAISQLPGQGTTVMRGQVERAMRQLVDQVVATPKVPGDVKSVLTRELTSWVLAQKEVEDAFFVVERSLVQVARFLHEKLTIHGQLVELRDSTSGRGALSPAEARAADERAGQLAKRSTELDDQIVKQLERERGVSAHVRLQPRLVLDPARRFLARLDAEAGITIRTGDVRVDLRTRVQLSDPLLRGRSLGITNQVDLHLRDDLTISGSHQNDGRTGDQFKVSLSWRF